MSEKRGSDVNYLAGQNWAGQLRLTRLDYRADSGMAFIHVKRTLDLFTGTG